MITFNLWFALILSRRWFHALAKNWRKLKISLKPNFFATKKIKQRNESGSWTKTKRKHWEGIHKTFIWTKHISSRDCFEFQTDFFNFLSFEDFSSIFIVCGEYEISRIRVGVSAIFSFLLDQLRGWDQFYCCHTYV